jgi:electron transfer flavoprotein alpha subunit
MPLTIIIPSTDLFNEETEKFIHVKETRLVLEHSLISISKWEAKFKKPFLVENAMDSIEKVLYYIKCMTVSPQNVDDLVYNCLKEDQIKEIVEYIQDPMTATWFAEDKEPKKKRRKEIQTSEVIYWQMIALQIPQGFEKWHLNRLLTLIRVCAAKNEEQYGDKKKMSKGDLLKRNAALNAQRRAKMHTKG